MAPTSPTLDADLQLSPSFPGQTSSASPSGKQKNDLRSASFCSSTLFYNYTPPAPFQTIHPAWPEPHLSTLPFYLSTPFNFKSKRPDSCRRLPQLSAIDRRASSLLHFTLRLFYTMILLRILNHSPHSFHRRYLFKNTSLTSNHGVKQQEHRSLNN